MTTLKGCGLITCQVWVILIRWWLRTTHHIHTHARVHAHMHVHIHLTYSDTHTTHTPYTHTQAYTHIHHTHRHRETHTPYTTHSHTHTHTHTPTSHTKGSSNSFSFPTAALAHVPSFHLLLHFPKVCCLFCVVIHLHAAFMFQSATQLYWTLPQSHQLHTGPGLIIQTWSGGFSRACYIYQPQI